jgi:hypothetical protein
MGVTMGGAIASCSSSAQIIPDAPGQANAEETVSSSSPGASVEAVDASARSEPQIFSIRKRFEEGALTLDIEEVHLQADQLSILIHITNLSDQIIRFYPNQGTLSTGIDEFEANIFLSDESLSGAIAPQEEKSGVLVFSSRFNEDLNLSNVNSLQLTLGQVIDMESITPHTVSIAFSLETEP